MTGTPTAAGANSVTVTADDGRGGTGSTTFSWPIAAANVAPVVTNPGSQSGTVGTAITALQIVATDGNGDALTLQRDGLAGGADDQCVGPGDGHADGGGGELGDGDGDDGRGGTGSTTFSWPIAAANVAPVVTNPGSQSGTVGTAITALQIVATDGNGDALTLQRDGLAGGADDQCVGPGDGHADGGGGELGDGDGDDGRGGTGSTTFSWPIAAANVAPVVTNPGSQSGTVGTAITALQIVATDGNGDALTYSATGLPAGLTISASGLVTGTPTAAGANSVTVTANDGRGGTRQHDVQLADRGGERGAGGDEPWQPERHGGHGDHGAADRGDGRQRRCADVQRDGLAGGADDQCVGPGDGHADGGGRELGDGDGE